MYSPETRGVGGSMAGRRFPANSSDMLWVGFPQNIREMLKLWTDNKGADIPTVHKLLVAHTPIAYWQRTYLQVHDMTPWQITSFVLS